MNRVYRNRLLFGFLASWLITSLFGFGTTVIAVLICVYLDYRWRE